jgi:membrane fusion protein
MNVPQPPLFRRAAVEASYGTQIGAALETHWRGVRVFTIIAFLLLGALFLFAATVEYAPVHRISSFVDPQGGLVRLKAPIDGRVVRVAVRDGATVKQNDLLAVVGAERMRGQGDGEGTRMRSFLEAEKAALGREVEAAKVEASLTQKQLDLRISRLREERDTVRAEVAAGERLLASLVAQSDTVTTIANDGFYPRQQAARLHDEVTQQEGRLATARGALFRIERDIATGVAERALIDARLAGTIERLRGSGGELDRLALRSELDAEQVLRAPRDGRVSYGGLVEGQSVVVGQPLLTLTPAGSPLTLKSLVPPAAVAAVRPGVEIRIAFRAYPRERYGLVAATIESISAAPVLPGELPESLGQTEPMFVATASLRDEVLSSSGARLVIQPGMTADALVPIERRTVLAWLLDPFLRHLNDPINRSLSTTSGEPSR